MMEILTSVSIEEEEKEGETISEGHLQLIRYRMQTGHYNEEGVRRPLADAIIEHAKWFQNAAENSQ